MHIARIAGISLLCLLAGSLAAKDIYKTTDKDGNVVYTDEAPVEGGEKVDVSPLNVVTSVPAPAVAAPPVNGAASDSEDSPADRYRGLAITSPTADESLWGTTQEVTATVSLPQPLQAGHVLRFQVDGKNYPVTTSNSVTLTEVSRGSHSVSAQVLDGSGRVLASAEPVTFHMKQFSANFSN